MAGDTVRRGYRTSCRGRIIAGVARGSRGPAGNQRRGARGCRSDVRARQDRGRQAHRFVHGAGRDRPRRHGRGIPRYSRGRSFPAAGCHQGRQAGDGYRFHRPALSERTPDPGQSRSSQHREALRRRNHGRRAAVLRHGVHPGQAAATSTATRDKLEHRGRGCELFRQVCSAVQYAHQQPDRSPRPEAGQHPGHDGWHAEAAGFRHRQDAERRRPAHPRIRPRRLQHDDAGIRQPGAGERRARSRPRATSTRWAWSCTGCSPATARTGSVRERPKAWRGRSWRQSRRCPATWSA